MAKNMRFAWTKTQIVQEAIAIGTQGGNSGDPIRQGGLNGVNLWGTSVGRTTGTAFPWGYGQGQGIPAGYAMLALDGTFVFPGVVIATTAVKEGDPIYITSGNVLTNASSGNTLYGTADEPGVVGTITLGVRVNN